MQPSMSWTKLCRVQDTHSNSNRNVFIYWIVLNDFLPSVLFIYISYCVIYRVNK